VRRENASGMETRRKSFKELFNNREHRNGVGIEGDRGLRGDYLKVVLYLFYFLLYWGFSSGPHCCQAGALPCELLHQPLVLYLEEDFC
jgi:hypothetical protein